MNKIFPVQRLWLLLIIALAVVVYMIRLGGPTDLESYAQVLNVGYILDLMTQGHWLVQHDLESAVMSKPPLHTWMMAPFAALFGLSRLALTFPSFLAVASLGVLVLETGKRRFGLLAGGLAALAIVISLPMSKQITLVRTDAVFMLAVAIAALAAFFAWERGKAGGRLWLFFWFMAAVTTLIKGPLGLVLAAGGLLSYFWEKRNNPALPAPAGPHLLGVTLFLVLTLGWFAAAWLQIGQPLIDKMLFSELVYHAVGEHRGGWKATDLLKPSVYLIFRYLPFSLPFLLALWRAMRYPAVEPGERRLERFLITWVVAGLLIFSVVKHQRADHLLPLWPACALLAGREMALWAGFVGRVRFIWVSSAIVGLLLMAIYLGAHTKETRQDEDSDYVRELRLANDAKEAAESFLAHGLDASHLHHLDTPITLQLYLGTYRPFINRKQLNEVLAEAKGPVDLALGNTRIESLGILERNPGTKRLFRWPEDETIDPVVQVYRIER